MYVRLTATILGLVTLCSAPTTVRAVERSAVLTGEALDAMLVELASGPPAELIDDEWFLRRATFDLAGRPPMPEERLTYFGVEADDRRARLVDRLLASDEFGRTLARYWSDVISYRVPPPELTFLNYEPFETWLAEELNQDRPWDEVAREILTAAGKIKEEPAATFVGYHQANATKLSAETARVFLGLQVQCAQCHDHPYEEWSREQFHQLAAFFARVEAKLPWNEGAETVVKSKEKGEYKMPDAVDPSRDGTAMAPAFLTGEALEMNVADAERRQRLAELVTQPENHWFARSFANRMWARYMGRGFCEPVDNLGGSGEMNLPELHDALSESFTASGYDVKALVRLIVCSEAYQRRHPLAGLMGDEESLPETIAHLPGDQVFDALTTAVALPNFTPPAQAASAEIRFPPPPKSTRQLVVDAFGYDPSLRPEEVTRTMMQAMFLMNNAQLQSQVEAEPDSGTLLAELLKAEPDDRAAIERLYLRVMARQPNPREMKLALDHLAAVGDRAAGFEDLLWSLLNSAEFTTRR